MHGRKTQWEPKDGYCFLHSLRDILFDEFGEQFDIQTLKALFISEIWAHRSDYKKFYSGPDNELVKCVELYLQKGEYTQECVDLVIDAATKIFDVNIGIFQEVNRIIHCISYSAKKPTNRDIFLKYNNAHYEAIVKRPEKSKKKKKTNNTRPTITDLGPNSDDEKYDSTDSSSSNSSEEEETCKVQDFQFDLGMELDENMRRDNDYDEQVEMEQNNDSISPKITRKWLPHLNFEQLESDVDDPHFLSTPSSTQDASTDCIDLTSDVSESNTTDTSTATTMPEYPQRRNKPPKYCKHTIDESRMELIEAKIVDEIPWDIDGDCKFLVKCCPDDWIKQTRDGRWFLLRTSSISSAKYTRKVGHCLGSYVCFNETCSKRLTENVINKIDFKREGEGEWTCGPCGMFAEWVYCGATKRVSFDRTRREALVEHQGKHTCTLKPNKREKERIIKEHPLPISGFNTPLKTKVAMMRLSMDRKDHKAVQEIAKKISTDDLKNRIRRLRKDVRRPLSAKDEVDVFRNIKTLKEEFTKEYGDSNLIYKQVCSELHEDEPGSFVFKTSNTSLEIAAKMAGAKKAEGEDSELKYEPAYFDGMHNRVRLYKTLTMWSFHPGMRMMIELAIMEAPRENTYYVTKFFELFQEAMREYMKDENYKWEPNSLMMDEAGCNFVAVANVFGEDFVDNFTMSCQYHFKNCAEQKMKDENVPADERKKFREWLDELCEASTLHEYYNICAKIESKVAAYGL